MINIQGREVQESVGCPLLVMHLKKIAIVCRISGSSIQTRNETKELHLLQFISCISFRTIPFLQPLSKWIRAREELAMAKLELHQRQTRHVLLKDELQHLQQALLQRKSP